MLPLPDDSADVLVRLPPLEQVRPAQVTLYDVWILVAGQRLVVHAQSSQAWFVWP